MLLPIVVFLLIFSLVVLVHEWGHFYFAKQAGVRVDEFGIGMPPRIYGVRRGGTVYSLNWIPFGGFVRIHGENADGKAGKQALINQSPAVRLRVLGGGILMNFLLAWVLLMVGFWLAMPPMVTPAEKYVAGDKRVQAKVIVLQVTDESPAQKADLRSGDYILSVDGVAANNPADFKNLIADKNGQEVKLQIERGGKAQETVVVPTLTGEGVVIGAWIDRAIQKVHYVWWQVPWIALQEAWQIIWLVIVAVIGLIYKLFTTASIPADLAGPVGIAHITADMMKLGWMRVWQFVIFLSLNLGVLNLVPFPALDGGRLLFVGLEVLRGGKKVPQQVEGIIHTIGFALMIVLLLAVTYRDILKWI